ncbi:MAG: ABC transporter substrate-binding protein [archaeon]
MSGGGTSGSHGGRIDAGDGPLGRTSRRGFLAAAGALSTGALAGCQGIMESDPDAVTFGTLTIPAVAEVLIARERGFFEDRNIDLEIERIQSAPKATPKLANGELDVATGSIGASVFNSAAEDVDVRIVADQTRYWRGQPSANRIWGREEAIEEASLYAIPEGLTIALHGRGNVDSYIWGRILQLNDLTWDDVEVTEILYNNMPVAMEEGEIDACAIPDPLGLELASQTGATQLGYASQVAPDMQIGVYLFGGPFATDRPEVARRWLEAYLEGVREYYDMGGFPDEEVAAIVNEAFELPTEAIRSSVPSLPQKNGRVNVDSVETQQAYHACRGTVETTVDVGEVIDESFLDDALEEVGRLDDADATPSVETILAWGETAPAPYPEVGEIRTPEGFPDDALCE